MSPKGDGNIGSWLDQEQAEIAALTARAVGFKPLAGRYERFLQSLARNRDAVRLLREQLPKCDVPALAEFMTLLVSTSAESRLVELKRKRGLTIKAMARASARKDQDVRSGARKLIARAERAFDARREGLAPYGLGALIVERYLRFRSGVQPSARELAALLEAGLEASGRPKQFIDHDLLRRNLRNYEKKHQHPLATGERCAQIIEAKSPQKPT